MLSDALRRAPRNFSIELDMDVCWEARNGDLKNFSRLIVRWNPRDKEWVRLMSNLSRDDFSGCQIFQAYRLRWQIELLFKELKVLRKSAQVLHEKGDDRRRAHLGIALCRVPQALLRARMRARLREAGDLHQTSRDVRPDVSSGFLSRTAARPGRGTRRGPQARSHLSAVERATNKPSARENERETGARPQARCGEVLK